MTFNTNGYSLQPLNTELCFKPCYKWMTFNTLHCYVMRPLFVAIVLNLVINGWPSILNFKNRYSYHQECFKPCYKWMTFNTKIKGCNLEIFNKVLKF